MDSASFSSTDILNVRIDQVIDNITYMKSDYSTSKDFRENVRSRNKRQPWKHKGKTNPTNKITENPIYHKSESEIWTPEGQSSHALLIISPTLYEL